MSAINENVLARNCIECSEAKLGEIKACAEELYRIRTEYENKKDIKYAIQSLAVGSRYGTLKTRLLIYGQNTNGWKTERGLSGKEYADRYLSGMLSGHGFDWIKLDDEGRQWDGRGYYLSRSKFWKMSERILNELSQDEDKDAVGSRIWQDFIAQANTCKIGYSDENGDKVSGNVKGKDIKGQSDICYELMCKEIELIKLTHIVFMTNDKEYSFKELVEQLDPWKGKYIKRKGYFKGAKAAMFWHPQRANPDGYFRECKDAFYSL